MLSELSSLEILRNYGGGLTKLKVDEFGDGPGGKINSGGEKLATKEIMRVTGASVKSLHLPCLLLKKYSLKRAVAAITRKQQPAAMDSRSGPPASAATDQPEEGKAAGSVQTQPRNSKTTKQTHPKTKKETEKAKATRGANKTDRPRGPSEHRA
ncbi:hypothetical protein SLEP1_g58728 [Rubroshorea leprosula]|uniref:Uncharacterized protein n=1 Tax=Rubroshorea leprosula TaxID=152421 RepID=A0AAV5MTV3_9ROSI|nr:hypothetical protein SLEP1_g58728 [Rubroshorea leprosula]